MPKRERRSSVARLNSAVAVVQGNLNDRLEELESENSELKQLVAALKGHGSLEESIDGQFAKSLNGTMAISINDILPFRGQPRKTFPENEISEMASWLLKDGQQEPLKVIETEDSKYQIWDGERRWRAAQTIGWSRLNAYVLQLPDSLHLEILKGFLSRKELNSLDRGEAIIQEISQRLNKSDKDIVSSIRSSIRKIERAKKISVMEQILHQPFEIQEKTLAEMNLNQLQQQVLIGLLDFQLNPRTFAAVDLVAYSLPAQLKNAVREKGIVVGAALALRKLWQNPPKIDTEELQAKRTEIIEYVAESRLSIKEVRRLVSSFYQETNRPSEIKNASALIKYLEQIDFEKLEDQAVLSLKDLLEEKLQKIDKVINDRLG
ncbi:MAG: ParB/RepB/Spo0J family partition protein [Synechococcus sp.]